MSHAEPIHSRRPHRRVPASSVFLALVGAIAAVSCRGDSPKEATVPPEVVAPPAPAAALSRFSVPVAYDIAGALRIVEQVVPRTFGAIDSVKQVGTDESKHYAFEAHRGPFTGFVSGNLLHLRATLAYRARGFFKPRFGPTLSAGCGSDKESERPRVVVELATPLTLTEDWHLRSHAQIVRVEPASTESRDRCDVSILHHDVTAQVVGAARSGLASQLPTIDRKISGVDLTGQVTGWWGILGRPIRLTDGVWLELAPERLRIGKLSGQSRTLVVPVSLAARPRIVTGSEPPAAGKSLPPLGRDSASSGFHVLLDGIVDYAIASNTLSRVIGSRSFSQAGQTITLAGINVAPETKGRLALTVRFTGTAKGVLRLVGTPVYDAAANMVTVPDLDYDLKTQSALVKGLEWLKAEELRNEYRRKARLPVAPALARGRELLLDGLNRKLGDAVTLSATVDTVAVRGISVTRDGVVIQAEARGQGRMAVRQQ